MSIINRRVTGKIDGDFVVFLIGARINRWWKLPQHRWFAKAMSTMLKELEDRPDTGFLGFQQLSSMVNVQYWHSVEQLVAYARNRDQTHFPAWVKFNKKIGSSGDIGIWHETYQVRAGEYECIYNAMPPFGLGKASRHENATGANKTAMGRLSRSDGSDAPVTTDGD